MGGRRPASGDAEVRRALQRVKGVGRHDLTRHPPLPVNGNQTGTGGIRVILNSDLFLQASGGAAYRNRTDDNLITSEVLYRLS